MINNRAIVTNHNEIRYMNEKNSNKYLYLKTIIRSYTIKKTTSNILIDIFPSIRCQILHKSISLFIYFLRLRDFVFLIPHYEIKEYIDNRPLYKTFIIWKMNIKSTILLSIATFCTKQYNVHFWSIILQIIMTQPSKIQKFLQFN